MFYNIIKTVTEVVAGAACTTVVKTAVERITPEAASKSTEILLNIGSLVIGGVVAKIGGDYVTGLLDKITGHDNKQETIETTDCTAEIDLPTIDIDVSKETKCQD